MISDQIKAERNADGSYTVTVGDTTITVEDSIALAELLKDMDV